MATVTRAAGHLLLLRPAIHPRYVPRRGKVLKGVLRAALAAFFLGAAAAAGGERSHATGAPAAYQV
ncbi:unnamed protein product [Spirodela intermedia]|uniref:Uncharacterized protein n=1 Tax=Spirodela intermedia TaxID=51605 RepID=A0A7I8KDT9_SPIIN|nr:unnamed protein product [Spirodela intermedia]